MGGTFSDVRSRLPDIRGGAGYITGIRLFGHSPFSRLRHRLQFRLRTSRSPLLKAVFVAVVVNMPGYSSERDRGWAVGARLSRLGPCRGSAISCAGWQAGALKWRRSFNAPFSPAPLRATRATGKGRRWGGAIGARGLSGRESRALRGIIGSRGRMSRPRKVGGEGAKERR